MRDIYIGGARDRANRIVRNYVDDQRRRHPNRDIRYYEWWDIRGIGNAIRSTPRGAPLNVIGHSMGGAEAIRQARATRRPIDLMVTIDPVAARDPLRYGPAPGKVRAWANVTSQSPYPLRPGNMAASSGGRVSRTVTDQADLRLVSSADHEDFKGMMRSINAQRAIDATYQRGRRR